MKNKSRVKKNRKQKKTPVENEPEKPLTNTKLITEKSGRFSKHHLEMGHQGRRKSAKQ